MACLGPLHGLRLHRKDSAWDLPVSGQVFNGLTLALALPPLRSLSPSMAIRMRAAGSSNLSGSVICCYSWIQYAHHSGTHQNEETNGRRFKRKCKRRIDARTMNEEKTAPTLSRSGLANNTCWFDPIHLLRPLLCSGAEK